MDSSLESGCTKMDENAPELTDHQRENILEQCEENGVTSALREADFYRPSDADQTSWLTSVFRALDLATDSEEVATHGRHDQLVIREIAREQQCPVCEEPTDHVIDNPQRLNTPSQIDGYWSVCVASDSLYIHNHGIGDYIGREKR